MNGRSQLLFKHLVVLLGFALTAGCASKVEQAQLAIEPNPEPQSANVDPIPSPAPMNLEPISKVGPAPVETTAGITEIVELVRASVEDSVILTYIENSPFAFDPSVEEILYLNDVGVPAHIVSAMLQHGNALRIATASAAATAAETQAIAASIPAPQAVIEQQPVSLEYEPPPEQITINYFFDYLSPYGTWMEMPSYGWCWQPTVSVIDSYWRPYCARGRWLYTDCGWYWNSYYSWGWAPFHYGRWFRHSRCGWLWRPDTIWGPAWVTWRHSPLYCGWAPLPPAAYYEPGIGLSYYGGGVGFNFGFGLDWPHYTFVSYRRFYDPHPYRYRLSGALAENVFNKSTVVNNYFEGPNNIIINKGVDRDRVASLSRNEIRKVAVRDTTFAEGKVIKPDRLERAGNSTVIYRHKIQNSSDKTPTLSQPLPGRELRSAQTTDSSLAPDTVTRSMNLGVPITRIATPSPVQKPPNIARKESQPAATDKAPLAVGKMPSDKTASAEHPMSVLSRQQAKPVVSPLTKPIGTRSSTAIYSASPSQSPSHSEPIVSRPVVRSEVRKQSTVAQRPASSLIKTPIQPRSSISSWTTTRSASSLPAQGRVIAPPPVIPPAVTASPYELRTDQIQSYLQQRAGQLQTLRSASTPQPAQKTIENRSSSIYSTSRPSSPPAISSGLPSTRATQLQMFQQQRSSQVQKMNTLPSRQSPTILNSRTRAPSVPSISISPNRTLPINKHSTPTQISPPRRAISVPQPVRIAPSPSVRIQQSPSPSMSRPSISAPSRPPPRRAIAPVSGSDPNRSSRK